ncbi:Homeobox protein B-H1 [Asimina triloba]
MSANSTSAPKDRRTLENIHSIAFAMCFPAYADLAIPKIAVQALYFLGFLSDLIACLFRLLGLSPLLQDEIPSPPDAAVDRAQRREHHQSLSAMLICELLPVARFRDLCGEEAKAAVECVICLREFEGDEEIRLLSNCEHVFHRGCLDRWMNFDQQTCPLCRAHLVPEEMKGEFKAKLWAAEEALFSDVDDLPTWHAEDGIL